MKDVKEFGFGIVMGMMISLAIIIMAYPTPVTTKKELIDRGLKKYDEKTGELIWTKKAEPDKSELVKPTN